MTEPPPKFNAGNSPGPLSRQIDGRSKTSRIISLIIGCLLLLPAIGLLFGGGALGAVYLFGRDDAGYFAVPLGHLDSPTSAISAQSPGLTVDSSTPNWLISAMETDVRLTATNVNSEKPMFIGVAPTAAVNIFLAGVPHDEYIAATQAQAERLQRFGGSGQVGSPVSQPFWTSQADGTGTLQIQWADIDQPWSIVLMNANGAVGISAAATLQVRADFLFPLALILFALGIVITVASVVLIAVGARDRDDGAVSSSSRMAGRPRVGDAKTQPVALTARLDTPLSRWQWLVKWIFVIPHLVVLVFLWPAFLIGTVIAGVVILFTGRYPRGLFEFNVGVLRWSWRVSYYAAVGGIGTDRYPPFTLARVPGYPATLEIAYPVALSRGLVLVKWWLLAIPHLVIIALATTNWWSWSSVGDGRFSFNPAAGGGILGLFTIAAGVMLLINGRYPAALFDLIIGFNRWLYRVFAYCALMTDKYPPFRLDQGGGEPTIPTVPTGPAPGPPVPVPTGQVHRPG